MPIDPTLELRAALKRRDEELAAATAALADAAAREEASRQRGDALARETEKLRATAPAGTPTPGVWGSAALVGLLRNWPRLSTVGAAVMALGTAYGGWDAVAGLFRGSTPPAAATSPAGSTVPSTAPPTTTAGGDTAAAVTKERDDLGIQLAGVQKERDLLSGQMTGAVKERDALKTRVSDLESQLGAATKDLTAATAERDQALTREKSALARGNVAVPPPPLRPESRAGFFDFVVPERAGAEIRLTKADMVGSGSTWPTKDCTVVPGNIDDDFTRSPSESLTPPRGKRTTRYTSIQSACSGDGIVVEKSKDWREKDLVRVFWQWR